VGFRSPKGKGKFWELSGPFKSIDSLAAKGITQYVRKEEVGPTWPVSQ